MTSLEKKKHFLPAHFLSHTFNSFQLRSSTEINRTQLWLSRNFHCTVLKPAQLKVSTCYTRSISCSGVGGRVSQVRDPNCAPGAWPVKTCMIHYSHGRSLKELKEKHSQTHFAFDTQRPSSSYLNVRILPIGKKEKRKLSLRIWWRMKEVIHTISSLWQPLTNFLL